jgi:hypothetical protein
MSTFGGGKNRRTDSNISMTAECQCWTPPPTYLYARNLKDCQSQQRTLSSRCKPWHEGLPTSGEWAYKAGIYLFTSMLLLLFKLNLGNAEVMRDICPTFSLHTNSLLSQVTVQYSQTQLLIFIWLTVFPHSFILTTTCLGLYIGHHQFVHFLL